jgi:signal transduction histidine kinase
VQHQLDLSPPTITLDQVIVTHELASRRSRAPDPAAENAGLRELARAAAREPARVPEALTRVALELCRAGSAGLSLLDRDPDGREVFRWIAIAGRMADAVGVATERARSPCHACLERGAPQLFRHPGRYFDSLAPHAITEGLVVPFVGEEGPLGAVWVMSHDDRRFDIEDQRLLTSLGHLAGTVYERVRLQTAAEEALRARDRFLAIASHDLRNLLNVSVMNLQMVERHVAGSAAERFAGAARRAGEQMSQLLTDLLDMAAIEAGRLQLTRAPVVLAELARDVAAAHEPVAAARGVRLRVVEETPAVVLADGKRLRQVLTNLIGNALKFSPVGGEVTLRVEGTTLMVEDQGPGIAPQEQAGLFERFASGPNGGHGLGLWIARQLVAAHGGAIEVDSRPGEGCAFEVTLPA